MNKNLEHEIKQIEFFKDCGITDIIEKPRWFKVESITLTEAVNIMFDLKDELKRTRDELLRAVLLMKKTDDLLKQEMKIDVDDWEYATDKLIKKSK